MSYLLVKVSVTAVAAAGLWPRRHVVFVTAAVAVAVVALAQLCGAAVRKVSNNNGTSPEACGRAR